VSYNTAEKRKASDRLYYEENREKLLEKSKTYYQENKEARKEYAKEYKRRNKPRRSRAMDRRVALLSSARERARKLDRKYDLTVDDIYIPEHCPIMGFKLILNHTQAQDDSPSLDRVDNNLGYVKGNVRVISRKANSTKSALTPEQIENLYLYVKGQI